MPLKASADRCYTFPLFSFSFEKTRLPACLKPTPHDHTVVNLSSAPSSTSDQHTQTLFRKSGPAGCTTFVEMGRASEMI